MKPPKPDIILKELKDEVPAMRLLVKHKFTGWVKIHRWDGVTCYGHYVDGVLHRDFEPAWIAFKDDKFDSKWYYFKGKLMSSEDKPSAEFWKLMFPKSKGTKYEKRCIMHVLGFTKEED